MLQDYKRKGINGAWAFLVSDTILLSLVMIWPDAAQSSALPPIAVAALGFFNCGAWVFTCWNFAKAKGYAGGVGIVLAFFLIFGVIAMILLPDKHRVRAG